MSYILTEAKIMTMRPGSSGFDRSDSLLVADGKIKALGSWSDCREQAGPKVESISLGGKVIVPAFCDTHTHFVELAKGRFQLKLKGISTIDGIRAAAHAYRSAHPKLRGWVQGDGWDINHIDAPRLIRRELLDELFPDLPVALFSKDYHAKWCNSLALQMSGLLEPGGDFGPDLVKRDADGKATGLIYESATQYIEQYVSPPDETLQQDAIRDELMHIYSLGLGGFHSMESQASAQALKDAQNSGAHFRYVWHFPLDDLDGMIAQGICSYREQGTFIIGGVKIFGDGSLGSRTAAMLDPYPDDPKNRGVLRYSSDELDALIHKAGEAGISCTIHAIGDLTVRNVIKSFNKYRLNNINNKLLQRLEHLQSIADEDLIPLRDSGVYCALQPVHLANDVPMIEDAWRHIRDRAYRFRDVERLGIPYGFGSDAPIETIDPFKGIYAAIARRPGNDPLLPCWYPEQTIGVEAALRAYTYGAAKGSGSEGWRGSLEPGKAADLSVIEDWSRQPEDIWLRQRCSLSMVSGFINHIDI